ncbi:oxidoreductase [Pseudovibrio japonicus]|uniref:Oxidoreductase n=1 Tax=Pseudovibrio japonicus TaxID=366534 RepID=A0ABQ3ELQ2_9HYPH|nr:molybdopterin cofactor-binding domain-containing protein [Pseudovibrio japonicus]GHB45749.1 oxidoreductase [Pseudovibrio japonicus]
MSPRPAFQSAPHLGDWVSIDQDGAIVLYSGRVELGQGALTAIRAMAAAELGCQPDVIRLQSARTDLSPNEGPTVGSMSIAQGGYAVRLAAAALREQLLMIAEDLLPAEREALTLKDGIVFHHGEKTELTVGALAHKVDYSPALTEDVKILGKGLVKAMAPRRIGLRERLIGTPFLHDLEPEGLLFGGPIHPPTMTSELVEIDLDALRARPGVVAVIRDGSFLGVVTESSYETARAVRWARNNARWRETATAPDDYMQALAGANEPFKQGFAKGDVEAVQGQRYETKVSRPYLSHASIGPSASLATWQEDNLEVYSHSQSIFDLRDALANVFAMDQEQITVIHHPGAGCYGHNGADDVALDAALLAKAVPGRPVKVVWDREDEFRHEPMGAAMVSHASAILRADGSIAAMSVEVTSPPHANRPGSSGLPNLLAATYLSNKMISPQSQDVPLEIGGGADRNAIPIYAVPNMKVSKRLVHSLPYRTSALRSLGAYCNVYGIETLMDQIALARGEDPIAFRLRHLDDPRARAVIEAVAADSRAIREEDAAEGTGWGIGFARYKNTEGYCAVVAHVQVKDIVRVTDLFAVVDVGETIDKDGVLNQVEGGMVQATSWTLKEAVTVDGTHVQPATWNDYDILRFSEVPRVNVRILDHATEPPVGAGELAQGPTAAAIGNAVRSAIGIVVPNLPISRDAVIKAAMDASND